MKVAINYSDSRFERNRRWNTMTAKLFGGVDKVVEYSPSDIDLEFYEENSKVLNQSRGGGYWLWKPYFIAKTLSDLSDGDYLFYSDSGAVYLNSVDYLIEILESNSDEIMLFESPLIEKQWTNKHLIKYMGMENSAALEENQIIASYLLIKKSAKTVAFINEYFELCRKEELVTDLMTRKSEEAFDHRHDQSILSLLAKQLGIKPYRDPSDYGVFPFRYFSVSRLFRVNNYINNYPVILLSNRKAHPLYYWLKYKVRVMLSKVVTYDI